jgi:hypothetical protein
MASKWSFKYKRLNLINMKAELKRIYCPDYDIKTYYPENEDNFSVFLQIFVGIEGEEFEESFDVELFTPQYLIENHQGDEIVIGKRAIIVFDYNFSNLEKRLKKYCDSCTGSTWGEIANKLMRMGKWEFEDYYQKEGL